MRTSEGDGGLVVSLALGRGRRGVVMMATRESERVRPLSGQTACRSMQRLH